MAEAGSHEPFHWRSAPRVMRCRFRLGVLKRRTRLRKTISIRALMTTRTMLGSAVTQALSTLANGKAAPEHREQPRAGLDPQLLICCSPSWSFRTTVPEVVLCTLQLPIIECRLHEGLRAATGSVSGASSDQLGAESRADSGVPAAVVNPEDACGLEK